jgi:hypothetical protein
MKNILTLIIFTMLWSCSGKNKIPSEIIQPNEMQNILWDVMRAQALSTEIARRDSTLNEVTETKVLTQKVFEIHNISSTAFTLSYNWYTNHPDVMRIVFDSLNAQNQRETQLEIKEKHHPLKLDTSKKLNPFRKFTPSKDLSQ